jgi:hypothetical protein
MAVTYLKPDAADTVGLTPLHSRIGTDVKNCAVLPRNLEYSFQGDHLKFLASYFWNVTAMNDFIANGGSNLGPFREDLFDLSGGGDPARSLVRQALDHLLTLPQFDGSQPGTLIWVET